jgi:tellurite resistance protein TerA
MTTLSMGANAPLAHHTVSLTIEITGASADTTALQLYTDGKVRGDGDMCFFNQKTIGGGAVSLSTSGARSTFDVDLSKVGAEVEKIVFTATLEGGNFGAVVGVKVKSSEGHDVVIETAGRSEAALILAEIYKRNGQWKLRNVSQGFNGGLEALATHFGVVIAAPTAAPQPDPAPRPAPAPKPVSLSKVSLTKNERTVSLKKDDGRFGRIRVNLNWNQKKKGGWFSSSKGIDLDLGAFVEFKSGPKTAVQALGDTFGAYNDPPFVFLKGDDRSGAATDGEWLEINGDMWEHFSRILIYAFIYEGVANWQETDGVVRVMVPNQPEIEVKMNEVAGNSRDGMCAVASLENVGGEIKVSREVRFFAGHKFMDDAYGWGMRWVAGSK